MATLPISYDVGLGSDGDLPVFCRPITGLDRIVQKVAIRLRTFLGEWILDTSQGLPFQDWIARKPPDLTLIGASVRREIETTPGVLRVERFTASFTPGTQTVLVSCTVVTQDGSVDVAVSPLGTVENRNPSVLLYTRGRVP